MMSMKWSLVFAMLSNVTSTVFADDVTAVDFVPKKIASSSQHTCVLSTKGQVKCWGYNSSGELGIGNGTRHGREAETMGPNLPMVNFGADLASDMCVGARATCIATTTGHVKCWGQNNLGQLGQERDVSDVGRMPNEMGDNLPLTNLGNDFKAKEIHCGEYTFCALSDTGKLKCWGRGSSGELGFDILPKTSLGRQKDEMGDKLPVVSLPAPVSYVAIGLSHVCAASKSDVYCWGNNGSGQIGIESTMNRILLPADPTTAIKAKIEDANTAIVIEGLSAGYGHTCATYHLASSTNVKKIKCWGSNADGALGVGSTSFNIGRMPDTMGSKLSATQIGMSDVIQVAAHDDYSCALSKNGSVKCWGSNFDGALGLGDTKSRGRDINDLGDRLPKVDLGLPVLALGIGANSDSTCAILINHEIKCWGYAFYGTLGYEDTEARGTKAEQMGESLPYVRYKSGIN